LKKKNCLLWYEAVRSDTNFPTFWKTILGKRNLLFSICLLSILFCADDGSNVFLSGTSLNLYQNIRSHVAGYNAFRGHH
jgi:hypothetical protein